MRKRTLYTGVIATLALSMAMPALASAEEAPPPGTPSTPISTGGVTPYIIDVDPDQGGNRTCDQVGAAFSATFDYEALKQDYQGNEDAAENGTWAFPWTGTDAEGSVIVTVTDGTFVAFSSTGAYVGAAIVKGSAAANIYYYPTPGVASDSGLASPVNPSNGSAGLSNLTFCGYPGPDDEDYGTLSVVKFYDANANGINDVSHLITGWKISVNGETFYTPYEDLEASGDYTVSEFSPIETNWYPTTPTSVDVTVDPDEDEYVEFGNLCLGGGGGLTLGFWSNRNGKALFGDGDLTLMVGLNLRTATGANFEPANYAQFRTWILNATATNMAYMLSAQLAAMELNVFNGFVDGTDLIYAPGTTSANALGYATVSAVMAEANTSLGANGLTVGAGAVRSYQEALKNALDYANNNRTFVQATPCPFSFVADPEPVL